MCHGPLFIVNAEEIHTNARVWKVVTTICSITPPPVEPFYAA